MLLADGRLARVDGAYRPVGDLTSLAVPATLTALIASRLDAMEPDDRALVSDAAVLGQSLTGDGLAAVSRRGARPEIQGRWPRCRLRPRPGRPGTGPRGPCATRDPRAQGRPAIPGAR